MRQKTSHLLIGSFVIVGSLLLLFGVIAVSSGRGLRHSVEVETYFTESVQGLEVGSPLRFRGVRIGEVRQISFVNQFYSTQHTYALVRVAVSLEPLNAIDAAEGRKKIADMVTRGLHVRLASQGITGALYLESDLDKGPGKGDLPVDWEPLVLHVPSAPSVLERFSASVDALLVRLTKLDLEGLVGEARKSLANVAAASDPALAGSVANELQGTLKSTREAIGRVESRLVPLLEGFQRTATGADSAMAAVRERLAGKATEQAFADFGNLLAEARPLLQELAGVLRISEKTLASLDRSVGGESRDLAALVTNLRQISDHLRGLSETLEQNPARLLFGDPPKPVLKTR